MTKDELKSICTGNAADKLIHHVAMKDVAFGPLSYKECPDHYKVTGIWYSHFLDDFMGDYFGRPLQEEISIKKEDLEKWEIVKLA